MLFNMHSEKIFRYQHAANNFVLVRYSIFWRTLFPRTETVVRVAEDEVNNIMKCVCDVFSFGTEFMK
jgi:hypothetical protein